MNINNDNAYIEETFVLSTPLVSDNNDDGSVWSQKTVTEDVNMQKVNMHYNLCYHHKWLENL
eukprot:4889032-Ditylum_brightwellii.AAC.1